MGKTPVNSETGLQNSFNTPLTKEEEKRFQSSLMEQAAATGRPVDRGFDYDVRGAWKYPAQLDERGHGTDKWKKPNHPTFSTGSIYQDGEYQGGTWTPEGTFKPSEWNLKNMPIGALQDYFDRIEGGRKKLILGESQ